MSIKRTIASILTVAIMISCIFAVAVADESGVSGFVERLYTIALERDSDSDGKAYWTSQLDNHEANGADVARLFFFSEEFIEKGLSEEEFILRLYRTFLDREPDQAGYDYWLSEMANGNDREYVFNSFVNSPEWANICASFGIISGGYAVATDFVADFVERIYTKALERSSDPTGCDYWVNEIISGAKTGSEVAYGFFFSSEFTNFRLPNDEYVYRLYRVFFNREADEAGAAYWISTLQSGKSREYVFSLFTASAEWANICATYGIRQGTIVIDENPGPANGLPGTDELNLPIVNPLDYTYEVYPICQNYNYILYIKTDNPDPYSFRLLDRDTVYSDEERAIQPARNAFLDVQYENTLTYRVYGGYICMNYMEDWEFFTVLDGTDGGTLELQYRERNSNRYTGVNYPNNYGSWNSTNIIVSCEPLIDIYDLTIQNFTSPDNSFFENMDAVQRGVGSLSIYPRGVYDNTHDTGRYPAYAASPYPELGLNQHTELAFSRTNQYMLLQWADPYDIDSQGFPGLLAGVARRLNPDAVIASTGNHAYISVTCDGQTKNYGGAGAGGPGELFLSNIGHVFTFRGGTNDFYTNNSLADWGEYYLNLCRVSDTANAELRASLSLSRFSETPAWIRVAYEGRPVGDYYYAYVYDLSGPSYTAGVLSAENCWVDGRYLNRNNVYQDITFEESLQYNPAFLIPNLTYTIYNYNGNPHTYTSNTVFKYDEESDCWLGLYSSYDYCMEHAPELVYTREQVLSLGLDSNHSTPPSSGYIYDGSVEPGTPFSN